jgi:glycogen synthase
VGDERSIVQIYRAADVFVLPSLSENLPNTIMEAMACGVPSIGFRVGGIPEEIDHQKNGYVAQYCDAADLAALFKDHYLIFIRRPQQFISRCQTRGTSANDNDFFLHDNPF